MQTAHLFSLREITVISIYVLMNYVILTLVFPPFFPFLKITECFIEVRMVSLLFVHSIISIQNNSFYNWNAFITEVYLLLYIMIVPQTMNTPLAGFHSSSVICQATKLPMEDLRDMFQVHTTNTKNLELNSFHSVWCYVLLLLPENKIDCYKTFTLIERSFFKCPNFSKKMCLVLTFVSIGFLTRTLLYFPSFVSRIIHQVLFSLIFCLAWLSCIL